MSAQGSTPTCDVFIAYRQGPDEGDACTAWLHDRLEGSAIRFGDERLATIRIYWDRDAASISDWRDQWRIALKTCRALILVCTSGTGARRQPQDWLFEEIDWWLSHRRTAPLLVDACGLGSTSVPQEVAEKWKYAQRVQWNASDSESDRLRLINQIRDGIVLSESGINNEELRSSIRKTRAITALGVSILFLGIILVVLAWVVSTYSDCLYGVREGAQSIGHMGPDPVAMASASEACEVAQWKVYFAEAAGVLALILAIVLTGLVFLISWIKRQRRHI